jgi:hypothetical protein
MFRLKIHTNRRALFLSGTLFAMSLLQAKLIISESLEENTEDGIKDEDGFPADWIEFHKSRGFRMVLATGGPVTQAAFLPACSDACSSCSVSQLQRPFKIGASFSSVSIGHAFRGVKMAVSSD